jgi:predicted glycosyl hydrolase (DUF1957 family)
VKPDAIGGYAFVLHSHIPYVLAHGRWPHDMDWLSECAAETYVPLLDEFHHMGIFTIGRDGTKALL